MRTLIVRTIMALCLCSVLSSSAGAQRIGNNNEERARFLLGQLETRLAKIRNFRCRKVTPQFVLQDGAEQEIASYSSAWLASDQQGRGRIRTTSPQAVDTQIWDGEKTIEHRQEIAADGKITHTVFAAPGKQYDTQRQDEPWIYLGRDLARLVTDALEKGHRLRVVQASDSMFRVDVRDGDGGLHSYVVDPQKGYMPVHRRRLTRCATRGCGSPSPCILRPAHRVDRRLRYLF
jgi:hypothetical protein